MSYLSVRADVCVVLPPAVHAVPACGASVAVRRGGEHVCDPERRIDFELFQLRAETAGLDGEIEEYLSSTTGRFEQWYADHERHVGRNDEQDEEPEA